MQIARTTTPDPAIIADFSYVIRGPHRVPHMGHIEARAWPTGPVATSGSFDDAVAAAKKLALAPADDGIHHVDVVQAHGILQANDGAFSIVPLGGFHREQDGPLFVDGDFFDRAALSLQVSRRTPELVAVVGGSQLLDLRHNGSAFVLSTNRNPPVDLVPTSRA